MSKRILLLICLIAPTLVFAKGKHSHLNTGSELRDWCKHKSSNYFSAKGLKHYNWTAATLNEDNFLVTKGEWLVERERIKVICRVKPGAHKRYATFAIDRQ